MFLKRFLVAAVLLPIGIAFIIWGEWAYAAFVAVVLTLAAGEYVRLFRASGVQPAGVLVVGGAFLLPIARRWNGFESTPELITLLILLSMTYHLVAYERGRNQAGSDFGVTVAGILYLGWIGAYLVSLRDLPGGQWWVLLAIPAIWFADGAAYFIGSRFGRHKLSPRLSPKKTWEGYFGGILCGVPITVLLAWLWQRWAGAELPIWLGGAALLGLAQSVLPTLGDLGESMIKRQAGVKDSSNLLPGHGGIFDRIDSWLWGGVIGYYLVLWLFRP